MTAPGVGAVVALTYRATVDQPQRFVHSRAVGAHVGLTPKRYQSGEIDYDGGVSKCGDALLRTMLYEAAHSLLTRNRKWSWLKAWGMRVAQRRGMRRAIVAVARRLAVVLHRMWVDGSEFRWRKDSAAVPAALLLHRSRERLVRRRTSLVMATMPRLLSLCPQAVSVDESPVDLEAEAGSVVEVQVTVAQFRMLTKDAVSQWISLRPKV
jgi:Transposase IS116/IS110/IS902 family